MSYTINLISINNSGVSTTVDITSKVLLGFSFVEKLDDALDVGQITLYGDTKSTPYTMLDTIEVVYDSNVIYSMSCFKNARNFICNVI